MALRPCLGYSGHRCTNLTRTARCAGCTPHAGRPTYDHTWAQQSRQAIADYRAQHGDTCPGWGVPPHTIAPTEWTTDHHVGPLCRSCNGRKGATTDKHHVQRTSEHSPG